MSASNSGRKPFTLWQLEVFCRVVELGGHSAAAEELDISQPAVSSLVGQLERLAGVPLLGRHGRTVRPTAEGRLVYEVASRAVGDLSELADLLRGLSKFEGGTLHLATGPSLASALVVGAVTEFRYRHPQVEVPLQLASRTRMVEGLEAGILDVAVLASPIPGWESIPLVHDEMVVLAAPDFEFPEQQPLTSLAGMQVFMRERATSFGPEIVSLLQSLGATVDQVISVPDTDALRRVLEHGLGVGIVPGDTFASEIPPGGLVPVDVAHFPVPIDFYVQVRPGLTTPLVSAFVEFLVGYAHDRRETQQMVSSGDGGSPDMPSPRVARTSRRQPGSRRR